MRVKREDERSESRWKPWLREKAILVWARLVEDVKGWGRSWAQYRVSVNGYSVVCVSVWVFRLDAGLA